MLDRPAASVPTLTGAPAAGRAGVRWSGLDGLRALAVVAVVTFHFAPSMLPGGFLGVDIFFVLSGYLITRMIVEEFLRDGRVRFGRFYGRRARRLLPAVATLLVAVLAASVFWRDQLATVRAAVLAACGYVSNWWLVYAHQSYFASTGRPSMLQHLWSLAVEEQFYLLWPLLAVSVLGRRGATMRPQRAVRRLALVAVTLAAASTAWMWFLAVERNVPFGADGSRLYYGTDTHGMGLLLGSALGALAAGQVLRPQIRRRSRWLWISDALALAAVAGLIAIVALAGQYDVWLYRGGYLAVAAVTGVCIATTTRTGSRVGRTLDLPAIRWLAARSYAIYLWHWPVAVISRPGTDLDAPQPVIQLGRVLLTLTLAELSYRLIETPVRRDGLRFTALRARMSLGRVITGSAPVGARSAAAGAATVVLIAVAVMASAPSPPVPAAQRTLGSGGGRHLHLGSVRGPSDVRLSSPASSSPSTPSTTLAPKITAAPTPTTARSTAPGAAGTSPQAGHPGPLPHLSAFGDSVMLGARSALGRLFPHGTLDAVEGRQPGPILGDVRSMASRGTLTPLVVIGVGDNGLIDPDDLRSTLEQLRGHHVIVINNRVGMPWEAPNNATISAVVRHFANARLLDWHAVAAPHPSWFYPDRIHLTPAGADAYAALIAALAR